MQKQKKRAHAHRPGPGHRHACARATRTHMFAQSKHEHVCVHSDMHARAHEFAHIQVRVQLSARTPCNFMCTRIHSRSNTHVCAFVHFCVCAFSGTLSSVVEATYAFHMIVRTVLHYGHACIRIFGFMARVRARGVFLAPRAMPALVARLLVVLILLLVMFSWVYSDVKPPKNMTGT